jgi:hypothetical protein
MKTDAIQTDTKPIQEAEDVPALFVATNLESWETDKPKLYAIDVTYDTLCFRRLDPDYYAWLRYKMSLAKKATLAGHLSLASFNDLKARFIRVHEWAMESFGKDVLQEAVNGLDAHNYVPPVPWKPGDLDKQEAETVKVEPKPEHLFPANGEFGFTHSVPPEAVAKVDAIRDQAISLGWSESGLYQNRGRFKFPCGQDYGLVCFLEGDKLIGEVTRQSIEIINPGPHGSSLRFYNPHVDQPWIKRLGKE